MLPRVFIGLGNPGVEYDGTRHNVGAHVLSEFASRVFAIELASWKRDNSLGCRFAKVLYKERPIFLVRPATFMNDSGPAVSRFCSYFKIDAKEVVVLCDDITIPVGEYKLTTREGDAGHNGIKSIAEYLGHGFSRFRIGIGGKKHRLMMLADHVIGQLPAEDREKIDSNLNNIFDGLKLLLDKGASYSMNFINRGIGKHSEDVSLPGDNGVGY
ncbi:MAG: aminoacyl-tRNA hydrolase [Puniceicoccales bacterium]|jgi:PTH1 family peptidyl-tRNA hydrolase|nr:aminoacyl-tRNA hydrolase [Puniceicoccales bacterium]